jgi:hypothetical protein
MLTLQDLLGSQQGSQAVDQISGQVGAEPSMVNTAIQAALPAILGGLARNASDPQGAQSLDQALSTDHDGSILNNLGGLGGLIFGQQQQEAAPPREADAGGILGHILGGAQGQVAQDVSEKSGLQIGQVAQILMMLAPIVMGYLGRQKQEQNLDPGGLSNWLGGQQQQIQQSPQGGLINQMLDSDGDGSVMDDLASMAMRYMSNR